MLTYYITSFFALGQTMHSASVNNNATKTQKHIYTACFAGGGGLPVIHSSYTLTANTAAMHTTQAGK